MDRTPTINGGAPKSRRAWTRAIAWLCGVVVILALLAVGTSQYADYTTRSRVSEGPADTKSAAAEAKLQAHADEYAESKASENPAAAPYSEAADASADASAEWPKSSASADSPLILHRRLPLPPVPGPPIVYDNPTPMAEIGPPPGPPAPTPEEPGVLSWQARIDGGNHDWCGDRCPHGAATLTSGQEYRAVFSLGMTADANARVAPAVERAANGATPEDPRSFWLVPLFDEDKLEAGVEQKSAFSVTYRGEAIPAQDDVAVVPFSVLPGATGCAYIWVSVWDSRMKQALDAFVVGVAVGTAIPDSGCPVDQGRRTSIAAGAQSALELLPRTDGENARQTVGLHAFELTVGNAVGSRAVVVARDDTNKPQIYGWSLKDNLSTSLDSERMARTIGAARLDLQNPDAKKRRQAYQKAGDALRTAIFQVHNGDADAAFELLQNVVKTDPSATISARFVRSAGEPHPTLFYIPLRFLAKASHGLPADGFQVIQPLSGRHTDPQACIARWTIAASPHLGLQNSIDSADVDAYARVLALGDARWHGPVIKDIEDLRNYFRGFYLQSPLKDHESEALVILSHHGPTSGIFFEQDGASIVPSEVQRTFPGGSAAFLAMCSASEPKAAAGMIQMLSQSGFDSILASPFQVDSSYSTRLVDNLVQQADIAYRDQKDLTLRQLFELAASETAKTYGDKPEAGQQALEFVIAGDPDLRLCKLPVEEN